jgi:hypothetical protein
VLVGPAPEAVPVTDCWIFSTPSEEDAWGVVWGMADGTWLLRLPKTDEEPEFSDSMLVPDKVGVVAGGLVTAGDEPLRDDTELCGAGGDVTADGDGDVMSVGKLSIPVLPGVLIPLLLAALVVIPDVASANGRGKVRLDDGGAVVGLGVTSIGVEVETEPAELDKERGGLEGLELMEDVGLDNGSGLEIEEEAEVGVLELANVIALALSELDIDVGADAELDGLDTLKLTDGIAVELGELDGELELNDEVVELGILELVGLDTGFELEVGVELGILELVGLDTGSELEVGVELGILELVGLDTGSELDRVDIELDDVVEDKVVGV